MDYKLCCYGTYRKCIRCEECLDSTLCWLEKRERIERSKKQGNGGDGKR